jgi:inosine-uridine nucleoside N-ribohydrolase
MDAPEGGSVFKEAASKAQKDIQGRPIVAAIAMAAALIDASGPGDPPAHLVCTGALTNAALALILYPDLTKNDTLEITLMGGALGIGNTGPVQEFNIQTDPEAAKIVFESGLPVTMVPIEVRGCI